MSYISFHNNKTTIRVLKRKIERESSLKHIVTQSDIHFPYNKRGWGFVSMSTATIYMRWDHESLCLFDYRTIHYKSSINYRKYDSQQWQTPHQKHQHPITTILYDERKNLHLEYMYSVSYMIIIFFPLFLLCLPFFLYT